MVYTIICDIPARLFTPSIFLRLLSVFSPAKKAPDGGASGLIQTGTLFANLFRCFLYADTDKALCPGRNTFKR
ncbi:MAG: hypothetical protein V7642_2906 [Burkholderiales bacterium]